MVTQQVTSDYVVRFIAETEEYERGTQQVERQNQRVSNSEQRLERERQRRDRQQQQQRRQLRSQGAQIGSQVAGRAGFGGAAGAIGLLGAGSVATAGVGAALVGVTALGAAAVNASIQLGTIQGIALSDDLEQLRYELNLLLAALGNEVIPLIRDFIRGFRDVIRILQRFGLLGGDDTVTQGRALTQFDRNRAGVGVSGGRSRDIRAESERTTALQYFFRYGTTPGLALQGISAVSNLFGDDEPTDFHRGGIVLPRPGGLVGRIAEAGQAEAVIPLRQLDRILGGNTDTRSIDDLRSAFANANILPPLSSRIADAVPVTIQTAEGNDATLEPSVDITTLTQIEYNELTEREGYYIILTPASVSISVSTQSPTLGSPVVLTARGISGHSLTYQFQVVDLGTGDWTNIGSDSTNDTYVVQSPAAAATLSYRVVMTTNEIEYPSSSISVTWAS